MRSDSISAARRAFAGTMHGPVAASHDGSCASLLSGGTVFDEALGGGLMRGALHEYYAQAMEDGPSALAFALLLALRNQEAGEGVLWLQNRGAEKRTGMLYGPGLVELGVDPDALTLIRLDDATKMLRAAVDGVRHGGIGVVLLEFSGRVPAYDLTASRRLTLAAEKNGLTVFVVRSDAEPVASVARTRWQVASAPSTALEANAPGGPVFDLELLRHRGGRQGLHFLLEWNRDKRCFGTPLSGGVSAPSVGGSKRSGARRAA